MAEPDRRGEIQRARAATRGSGPGLVAHGTSDRSVDEGIDGAVHGDGVADEREMPRAFEDDEFGTGDLGECAPLVDVLAHVVLAVDDECRYGDVATPSLERGAV